jgi:hypothetical protein
MLDVDKSVISFVAEKHRLAARIFVTGEAAEDYIGAAAVRCLIGANDVYCERDINSEPLFVETKEGTIRMARFEPRLVWGYFHPDLLFELFQDEVDRLGVGDKVGMVPRKMDYFDFYQSMAAAMKEAYGENIVLMKARSNVDDLYQGVYLACLLLFGKPGYMDVPAAAHFAQQGAVEFIRTAIFLQLRHNELKRLEELREKYGGLTALTNPEVNFVIDLYERVVKECG